MIRYQITALLFMILSSLSAAPVLVKNGHAHPISLLQQKDNILFSGDTKGTLKAWSKNGDILTSLQVSDMPVYAIDFSRKHNLLVVLSGRPGTSANLSVWSWDLKKELYSHTIPSTPLSIAISPQGRYIVYSLFEIDSMHSLYALSGKKSSMLRDIAQLVSDFAISNNEQRIMTYSRSSGNITYYTINSGKMIQSIRTSKEIQDLTLLPERRFAVGFKEDRMLTIDVLSGNVVSTHRFSGYTIEDYSLYNNTVALLLRPNADANTNNIIETFTIESGKIRLSPRATHSENTWNKIAMLNSSTYILSAKNETLYTVRNTGKGNYAETVFVDNSTIPITAFYSEDTRSIVASNENIYTFNVSLNTLFRNPTSSSFTYSVQKRNRNEKYNWIYNDNESIKLHSQEPALLDIVTKENSIIRNIQKIQIVNDNYLTILTKNKTLLVYDIATYEKLFEYSSINLETYLFIPDRGMYLGVSADTDPFGVPLYQVTPKIGETIPMQSSLFLILDIAFDENEGILWSLGLRRNGEKVYTALEGRSGENFEYSWIEKLFLGESFNNRIAINQPAGSVMLIGTKNSLPSDNSPIYRVLGTNFLQTGQLASSYLISTNNERTLEIWDTNTMQKTLQLYLLPRKEWIAVIGQNYLSSLSHTQIRKYLNRNTTATKFKN